MNMKTQFIKKFLVPVCCLLLAVFVFAGGAPAQAAKSGDAADKPAGTDPAASPEKKSDQPAAAAAPGVTAPV